jgi:hypothetical protein
MSETAAGTVREHVTPLFCKFTMRLISDTLMEFGWRRQQREPEVVVMWCVYVAPPLSSSPRPQYPKHRCFVAIQHIYMTWDLEQAWPSAFFPFTAQVLCVFRVCSA